MEYDAPTPVLAIRAARSLAIEACSRAISLKSAMMDLDCWTLGRALGFMVKLLGRLCDDVFSERTFYLAIGVLV